MNDSERAAAALAHMPRWVAVHENTLAKVDAALGAAAMSGITYAGKSVCPSCKRIVRHKPMGGPLRWHGCRLRWIARRVARARSEGWDEGYRFALDNISDPLVYADLTEYGTGWAGHIARGGIEITGGAAAQEGGDRG